MQPSAVRITQPTLYAGLAVLTVAIACAGCSWLPWKKSTGARSGSEGQSLPATIQAEVMRFADRYTTGVAEASEAFRGRVTTPEARLAALKWKLSQATGAYIDASGANPIVALLDIVSLATLSRMAAEDGWVRGGYGDAAEPLAETHRRLEAEAWTIAARFLKPTEQQQLHDLINRWRADNPDQVQVSQIRLLDFAVYGGEQPADGSSRPSSLLGLLRVDPLAGLEPTARSIEEARLLAERSAYYLQRLPTLMSWHAELLTYELAVTPESRQVLSDAERLTRSVELFAKTAEQLPQVVNDQREAAINQFFGEIDANEKQLRASLVQLRETAEAGTELAKSTDAAIQSLDRFVGRFDKGKSAAGTDAKRRSFDILDYATTAKEVAAAMHEVNATLTSLDETMPRIEAAAGALGNVGNRLLQRLLLVGAALIVLLVGSVLAAALAYRRFARPATHKP